MVQSWPANGCGEWTCRSNAAKALLCKKHSHIPGRTESVGIWTLDFAGARGWPQPPGGVRFFCQGVAELGEEINQRQLSCNQYLPLLESLAPPWTRSTAGLESPPAKNLGLQGRGVFLFWTNNFIPKATTVVLSYCCQFNMPLARNRSFLWMKGAWRWWFCFN